MIVPKVSTATVAIYQPLSYWEKSAKRLQNYPNLHPRSQKDVIKMLQSNKKDEKTLIPLGFLTNSERRRRDLKVDPLSKTLMGQGGIDGAHSPVHTLCTPLCSNIAPKGRGRNLCN